MPGAHAIKSGKSLHLNIDGSFTDLTTLEQLTTVETKPGYYSSGSGTPFYLPPYNVSSKRYFIAPTLLERMANADKFVIRVDLEREYVDAVCTNEKTAGVSVPAASTSYGIRTFLKSASLVKN
jgi:hypothetical protein